MQNPDDRVSRGESSAKARNFIKTLQRKDVILFMHFLLDVVDCLTKVSLVFQLRESSACDIYNEIEAAKAVLATYKDK